MAVSEFLSHVRRLVVDFVVGRVPSGNGAGEAVSGLDEVTNYYLLHRHSFGMGEVPVGPCILYAISCGLSDGALVDQFDLLTHTGGREGQEDNGDDESEGDDEAILSAEAGGSGSQVKLKPWNLRRRPGLGYPSGAEATYRRRHAAKQMTLLETTGPDPKVRQIPLIDQVHRLLHLWRGGDQVAVNDYLEERGLLRNPLFQQLLQALIELAPRNSEERSLLESLSNHVSVRRVPQAQQDSFNYEENRMMATEIIFVVEESPEGGFEAKALGHAIFTQGETVEEVRKAAKDAVACHFEEPDRPRMIRLHWVRDELIAV